MYPTRKENKFDMWYRLNLHGKCVSFIKVGCRSAEWGYYGKVICTRTVVDYMWILSC